MPLAPEQIERALTIHSHLIAALYRGMIAQGQIAAQEYRDLLDTAEGGLAVPTSLIAGPLAPLYRLQQQH